VGLSNTRERLEALYGERATLEVANAEGGGAIATVRLPYHEVEGNA
jgi:sensor histidine kinase YesM